MGDGLHANFLALFALSEDTSEAARKTSGAEQFNGTNLSIKRNWDELSDMKQLLHVRFNKRVEWAKN